MEGNDIHQSSTDELCRHLASIGLKTLRGITIKQLDEALKGHNEWCTNAYLTWLQEQLSDWDLSDITVYRPQIQAWCVGLRDYGLKDESIFKSFTLWKSIQTSIDVTTARRFLVAEMELHRNLHIQQQVHSDCHDSDLNRLHIVDEELQREIRTGLSLPESQSEQSNSIIVNEETAIEISSGAQDSDEEVSECKVPDYHSKMTLEDKKICQSQHLRIGSGGRPSHSGCEEDHGKLLNRDLRSKSHKTNGVWTAQSDLGNDYVCRRCNVLGHSLADCPTNLYPNYDIVPDKSYQCNICKLFGLHYGSLCPRNKNASSLIRERLRVGIISQEDLQKANDEVDRKLAELQRAEKFNRNSKIPNSRREVARDTRDDWVHKDRRTNIELNYGDPIHESRRMLVKRARSTRDSPPQERRSRRQESNHYDSPEPKRSRRDIRESSQEHGRGRGRGRVREQKLEGRREREHRIHLRGPSETRTGSSGCVGSSELLVSRPACIGGDEGRLSFWDDGYETPQVPAPSLSYQTSKRFLASELRVSERKDQIFRIFPHTDACWVDEMADFDVDLFLTEMDRLMTNKVPA